MTRINSQVRLAYDVLCSGRFEVPWHQRYYDWKDEHVKELLSDLKDALDTGKTCYFLGSIMLVRMAGGNRWRINDGQQRLITLSLIVAALCRRFARKRPRDTSRETLALRALFSRRDNEISKLTETSKYHPRIDPPKNNKSTYAQIIRGHDIGTNGLLTSSWKTIDIFVDGMNRSTTEAFFEFVAQKIEISVLEIPDDVDANSVFEALNARGKPLDDVDLIRNRLYSYFSEADDTTRRETVHDNLENTLVIGRNARTMQEYFRCYLQCRYGYLKKTRFYRESRIHIEKAAGRRSTAATNYVFDLVEELGRNDSIELFRSISSSRSGVDMEKRLPAVSGKRNLAVLLNELRSYKVSHPLVFALLHRFVSEADGVNKRKLWQIVTRSLKNLASFVMRNVFVSPKFEPSKFEAAFANCAHSVFNGSDLDSADIMSDLQQNDGEWNVMDDAIFIRRMTEVEFRDNKKALRYLLGINAKMQRSSEALREDRCSVEHILPQSDTHGDSWTGFSGTDANDWRYRAGNLVIVARSENRSDAEYNRNFAAKKRAFRNSMLSMPRLVAEEYDDWTPKVVEKRSRELAREAAKTWRFFPGS